MDYVISDLHLGEERIMKAQLEPFETALEKEEHIIKNWNKVVTSNESKVYILGDIGQVDAIRRVLPQLRGYKILVKGNHDNRSNSFYKEFFDEVYDTPIYYNPRILLSHYPTVVDEATINLHGHTHLIVLNDNRYFNVCVEMVNYMPQQMKHYEKEVSKIPKLNTKFLEEWYADMQISKQRTNDLVLDENRKIKVEESKIALNNLKIARTKEREEREKMKEDESDES